jgi:hypothetical protein
MRDMTKRNDRDEVDDEEFKENLLACTAALYGAERFRLSGDGIHCKNHSTTTVGVRVSGKRILSKALLDFQHQTRGHSLGASKRGPLVAQNSVQTG